MDGRCARTAPVVTHEAQSRELRYQGLDRRTAHRSASGTWRRLELQNRKGLPAGVRCRCSPVALRSRRLSVNGNASGRQHPLTRMQSSLPRGPRWRRAARVDTSHARAPARRAPPKNLEKLKSRAGRTACTSANRIGQAAPRRAAPARCAAGNPSSGDDRLACRCAGRICIRGHTASLTSRPMSLCSILAALGLACRRAAALRRRTRRGPEPRPAPRSEPRPKRSGPGGVKPLDVNKVGANRAQNSLSSAGVGQAPELRG